MLTMFQILFKGLKARVELSETEVRLAKQSVRCDSTDEGEATLGCSQSLPKAYCAGTMHAHSPPRMSLHAQQLPWPGLCPRSAAHTL